MFDTKYPPPPPGRFTLHTDLDLRGRGVLQQTAIPLPHNLGCPADVTLELDAVASCHSRGEHFQILV